jgi:hypothetical protein
MEPLKLSSLASIVAGNHVVQRRHGIGRLQVETTLAVPADDRRYQIIC